MSDTKESSSVLKGFNIKALNNPKVRVTTSSGYKVEILTTEADDPVYKIQGFIGKSTQLESWTSLGKYYARERKKDRFQHINNLTIIE